VNPFFGSGPNGRAASAARRTRRWLGVIAALLCTPIAGEGALRHQWTFNDDTAKDLVGRAHGVGFREPAIIDGKLLLNGVDQCVITGPIEAGLSNWTLVVWVALSNLTQSGAVVAALCEAGSTQRWDAIQYGGRRSRCWNRSDERQFSGSAPGYEGASLVETNTGRVMLTMVRGDDAGGSLRLYRDAALRSQDPIEASAARYTNGQAHLIFGLPHASFLGQKGAPEGADPALAGSIDEARLYDRALSATEVAQIFATGPAPSSARFWQTMHFQVSTALAVAGLLIWSVRARDGIRRPEPGLAVRDPSQVEVERSRIAQDMHDALGANLTRIKLLSELVEREADCPEKSVRYARSISRIAREVAQGMDEIIWAVNPAKDHLENFVFYLGAFTEELLGVTHLRYRLDFPDAMPDLPLPAEFRHQLFLAIKEALHNTVKHSYGTQVWVRLEVSRDELIICVRDDGRGFTPGAPLAAGNGLGNMARRLALLGGDCVVDSRPGHGTAVRFSAPLPA